MRNIPRSVLRRRRFLQSTSVLAIGAVGSILTGRKLLHPPSHPTAGPGLAGDDAPSGTPGLPPDAPEPEVVEAPPPLDHEDAYAEFLASLDLRYIRPHEVINPHRASLNNVANRLPPEDIWERLAPTLRAADEIRDRLGAPLLRITSAYRCPTYNRQIPGAAARSFHTRNQALDLVYGGSNREAAEVARRLRNEGAFCGGIGVYPTFIHIDTRGYNANWRG
ncbi:MAG: DUF882 domain-containing protein [Akkermansiaceae bacterium]|nr:DUF882 domain-containing protein [Akkermansiaceae bacterium]NNM28481.1 DUF882 domain-containing protein [Akkermansiaceae bacterium]